ncbi:MAG: GH1, partial [uncultured Acidimicrobiales bacterium]
GRDHRPHRPLALGSRAAARLRCHPAALPRSLAPYPGRAALLRLAGHRRGLRLDARQRHAPHPRPLPPHQLPALAEAGLRRPPVRLRLPPLRRGLRHPLSVDRGVHPLQRALHHLPAVRADGRVAPAPAGAEGVPHPGPERPPRPHRGQPGLSKP